MKKLLENMEYYLYYVNECKQEQCNLSTNTGVLWVRAPEKDKKTAMQIQAKNKELKNKKDRRE